MKVFISAVTSEFGRARDLLANSLQSRPIEVRVQRSFVHEHGAETLLDQLHDYIAGADRVVAIMGQRSGAFPEEAGIRPAYRALLPQGMTRASYTQWEVIFGLHHHPGSTKIHIAAADYQADAAAPGDDLTNQAAFLAHITAKGLLRRPFTNADQLRANVLEERWPEPVSHCPKNLPFSSIGARFIGREDFLTTLDQTFKGGARAVAIQGMGGLGKTRTAIEYALSRQTQFAALLYLSAKSPDAIEAGLAALVGPLVLDLPEQAVTEQHRQAAAAIRWLQGNEGWLLILDNVDNEVAAQATEDLVAKLSGGQVLITTRIDAWGAQVEVVPLGFLSPKASVDLLLASTPNRRKTPEDAAEAAFLAEEVDRLCLALVQAAANIDTRRLTLTAYRAQWERNKSKLLMWHDDRKMGYPLPVAVTWLTTIDQLSEPAKQLLNQLSYLSHEPIPESLMDVVVDGDEAGAVARRAALDELARYSMALRDPDKPEFAIHRLVQLVTRERLGTGYTAKTDTFLKRLFKWLLGWQPRSKWRNAAENAITSLMRAALPAGSTGDVRTWPSFAPLVSHFEALARLVTMESLPDLPLILIDLGSFYGGRANYGKAEPLFRRALRLTEENFRPDHPYHSASLGGLANLLLEINRLEEAEYLFRRSWQLGEVSLGLDHPDVAARLNNLARLLQETNRPDEAEPLFRRALKIGEDSLGANHPRFATRLNNLASLMFETGRLDEAEPLFRRALEIDEANFGLEHPEVATDLNNLATLLYKTNRLNEAELLFDRALKINEAIFGPDHPKIASALNNLAGLLHQTKRSDDAEKLYRRALLIDEASFGPDHPNVAARLNNLATLQFSAKRPSDAQPLYLRSLLILLKSFKSSGYKHPNLDRGLNNYVEALEASGLTQSEINSQLASLHDEAGLPRPEGL